MERINLWIKDDQIAKLRALSHRTGAPFSELIRRAIDEYLKKAK